MYTGSCLCQSVKYEVDGALSDFGQCHCRSCQKASGSAYAANAGVRRGDFRVTSGAADLREFESSPGKLRVFCSRCGSPIYAYLRADAEHVRIRLGTLDTPLDGRPKAHFWVSEKAPWEIIESTLPQFPGWAPRDVLDAKGSKQP
jgi:hypothetical protein